MGEIAEMMLEGTLCEGCGEAFDPDDESPGYPRRCAGCRPNFKINLPPPRRSRRKRR